MSERNFDSARMLPFSFMNSVPGSETLRLHFPPSVSITGWGGGGGEEGHGLINYIDGKSKCRHLQKFTCEGILRQVFIRVYRMEKQSVILLFSTQHCELLHL
jgi:hypothetical protein